MFGGIGDKVHAEIDAMLNEALDSGPHAAGRRTVQLFDAVVKELLDEDTVDLDRLKAIWAEMPRADAAAEAPASRLVRGTFPDARSARDGRRRPR